MLVHGFTGNPAHFRHLGGQLNNRGYTINAPLLPGHATRFEDLGTVTRHDWIESTLDAVREVGDHHRIHIVGLSMGGLLSIVAADRTSVATLTTIDSPVRFRDKRVYLARVAQFRKPEVRWVNEHTPELEVEVGGYWIHAEGFPTVAAAEMLSLSRYARRVARRVSIPSLVIQSRTDETVHPSSGPLLKKALGPTCRLLWLENSMHNALFDSERDVIRDAVLELVTR